MPPAITVVLTIYKDYPTAWVGPCLESLLNPGGVRNVVVVTDQVNPAWVHWANTRQVSLAAVKITANGEAVRFRQFADSLELRSTARLVAWRMGMRLVAPGSPFVALDVDTLVRRPLTDLFKEATPPYFGLALPRVLLPSGQYGYRSAVVAGQATPMVERYLDDWVREIARLGSQRAQLRKLYGSLESAAWHTLVSRAEESGGIVLAHVPLAWCAEFTDGLKAPALVHFQRWVPTLSATYEDTPPRSFGAEIDDAWFRAGKWSGL